MKKLGAKSAIKGILVLTASVFSLVAMLVVFTFSWYSNGVGGDVNGITFEIHDTSVAETEIEEGEGVFSTRLKQLAGDGNTFYKPVTFSQSSNVRYDDSGNAIYDIDQAASFAKLSSEELSECALVATATIIGHEVRNLYLDDDCSLLPKDLSQRMWSQTFTDPSDKSAYTSYGHRYSMDYIAGAMRVAFYKLVGDEFVLHTVWVPNPTYQLIQNEATGYWMVDANGTPETSYLFYNEDSSITIKPKFNEGDYNYTYTDSTKGVKYCVGKLNSRDTPIVELNAENRCQSRIRVVVWMDGNDRECKLPLMGYSDESCGRISIKINMSTL